MTSAVAQRVIPLPGRAGDPRFHLAIEECGEGQAVVFVHGFPDLARGWQHQLPVVAEAGFRAIAPDMRGYGASSCPEAVDAYTLAELTGDLVALLDALEIEKAIFVGHDWGGFVAWAMPVLHPERVAGITCSCTPYIPFPSVAKHEAAVGGDTDRQYVAWFQKPGVAEAYMDPRARTIVDMIMRTAPPLEEVVAVAMADGKLNMNPFIDLDSPPIMGEPFLSEAGFEHYVSSFSKTGFRGGINWYRNIDGNRERHPDVGVVPLDIPCMMLMADRDPALRPEFAKDMPERCSDLEMHLIEEAGHWAQQEQPEVFNRHLVEWLQRRFPPAG
jgi:pimeloyl-ACP methyl ester carboxylesterase